MNILKTPVKANTDGFLLQLKEVVDEYKYNSTKNILILSALRKRSIQKRFSELINYRHTFLFDEKQKKLYADLVNQYESNNSINYIDDIINNDTKSSLLGEFA
jgi:hypothetical protein